LASSSYTELTSTVLLIVDWLHKSIVDGLHKSIVFPLWIVLYVVRRIRGEVVELEVVVHPSVLVVDGQDVNEYDDVDVDDLI
jgi:hypothetical protein